MSKQLRPESNALILSPGIAKDVWKGKADMIILDKHFKSYEGKLFYLIDQDKQDYQAYGIIKLLPPDKISTAEFSELSDKHNLDLDYKAAHWPTKEVLFSYKFNSIKMFDKPIKVTVNLSKNTVDGLNPEELTEREYSIGELKEMILSSFSDEGYTTDDKLFLNKNNFKRNLSNFAQKQLEELAFDHKPFKPMICEMSLTKEMFLERYEKRAKYGIEPLYEGKRVILMKFGMISRLFSEDKTDISKFYPEIVKNSNKISGKDFVLDGWLSCGKMKTFDCLQYGDLNLSDSPWFERKTSLSKLHFNENISEVTTTIIENRKDLLSAIDLSVGFKDSIGCTLKKFSSRYNKDNKSDWTLIFSDTITTDTPGIDKVQGKKIKKKIIKKDNEEENNLNEGYFDTWNPTTAYFLGFLAVDGYIDVKRNQIEITISNKEGDASILNVLGKGVGVTPTKKGTDGLVRIRWTSKVMVDKLKKIGFGVKKEQRHVYKHVPSAYIWPFIRGVFDADGYMAKDKKRIQVDNGMSGQQGWLFKQLKSIAGKDAHLYKYTKHWKVGQYKILVLGEGAVKVHKKVYSGAGPAVQRKKNVKW